MQKLHKFKTPENRGIKNGIMKPVRLNYYGSIILMLIILYVGGCCFSSCTVKKSLSKSKTETDSVSVIKSDEVKLVKADSAGTKSEEGAYTKETVVIEYGDSVVVYGVPDYEEENSQLDFEPREKLPYVKHTSAIKRITTIRETGNYAKQETAQKTMLDSSSKKLDSKTELNKTEKNVTSVKAKGWDPLLVGGVGLLIVLAGLLYYAHWKQKRDNSTA